MVSLTSARELAATSIQKARDKYKRSYDRHSNSSWKPGDWVLVRFPQEESGANHKLSRPWHGPYRVTSVNDPDLSSIKVYFPQDQAIRVHQSRIKTCPLNFPSGFYWYGGKRRGPGRPLKWVSKVLNSLDSDQDTPTETSQPTQTPNVNVVDQSVTTVDLQATECNSTPPVCDPPRCKYPLRNRGRRSGRT